MRESPLDLSCSCYRFSEYEINEGLIRPTAAAQKIKIIEYNPFDSLKDTLEKRPDHKPGINELPIHVSFSSIKSSKDALEWVNNYGLPFSYYTDTHSGKVSGSDFPNTINFPHLKPINSAPVDEICKHASLFYEAINLYNMIKNSQTEDIYKKMNNNIAKKNYDFIVYRSTFPSTGAYRKYVFDGIAKLWDNTPASAEPYSEEIFSESDPYYLSLQNAPIALAQEFLSKLLSYSTHSVRELLIFDQNLPEKPPKIAFIFSSLLALLYKMLFLDWSQGHSVIRCANKNCNKMFFPFNDKSEYCCKACGDCVRSQKQRDKKKANLL